jgi:hypothetical protein
VSDQNFRHIICVPPPLSDKVCWKYCAEGLYLFKKGVCGKSDFGSRSGAIANNNSSLTPEETANFYSKLGFKKSDVKNISADLLRRQPVIVGYSMRNGSGHLALLVGMNSDGKLLLNDGCLSIESGKCRSGEEAVTIDQLSRVAYRYFWY